MVGRVHELRTWPEHFAAVASGVKSFEVRRDDRGFAVGDTLLLREYDPETCRYSGHEIRVGVLHKLSGGQFGIEPGYCVLGISRVLNLHPAPDAP